MRLTRNPRLSSARIIDGGGTLIPVLKAYCLGSASYLGPRILTLLLSRAKRKQLKDPKTLYHIAFLMKKSTEPHRFPSFCGVAVAVSHLFRPILLEALERWFSGLGPRKKLEHAANFFSAMIGAGAGFRLLNLHQTAYRRAGRTIDLTIVAALRATDVIAREIWHRRKARLTKRGQFSKIDAAVESLSENLIFAASAGIVMYAWVYAPHKLPASYSRQLTSLAKADERLLTALRRIRSGEFVYGKDTGQAKLLGSYCKDIGLPGSWGDPAAVDAIPCAVVHAGITESCELNAIRKGWDMTWRTAFPIYTGLGMVRFLRLRKPAFSAIFWSLIAALRSSAFLGAFVALFWYGVCLARTRIGPRVYKGPQTALDNLCIQVGCLLCGWSIVVENAKKRAEFMYFVAPRAVAAVLPRTYDPKYQWVESSIFALSAAVIMTAVRNDPRKVPGVLGKILGKVLK